MATCVKQLGRSSIVYDDSIVGQINEQWFDPQWWPDSDPVPGQGGRGNTRFVDHEGGQWVLRHYYRGGFIGRFVADRYWWSGFERSRPWLEWTLLARLASQGLPVPRPIAARTVQRGMFYTGDLITQRIPNAAPLAWKLANGAVDASAWKTIGRVIAEFHAAGVFHSDLNAHNILLDDAGKVFVLDFDRGRIMSGSENWQQTNLDRLKRSLAKISAAGNTAFAASDWEQLRAAYEAAQISA